MTRLLFALAVVAIVAAVSGCGGDKSPTATKPASVKPFVGVVSEDVFAEPGTYRLEQMRKQVASGVRLIRQKFDWAKMEKTPGQFDLRFHDRYVLDAARAGITIMPILFDPPSFRERALSRDATPTTTAPPTSLDAMARWARWLVRRYGTDGTLWRENPAVPKHPIVDWQVWNEPNLPAYWNAHPSAAGYVRMLRVVGAAIHEADPNAQVVTAGLTESRLGIPFAKYLRQLYAHGVAGTFDVLAVNAYSESARGVVTAVTQARRITAAAEDGNKPLWLTEFGWATPPSPRGSFTVSARQQANLVATALKQLHDQRERLGLLGAVYYQWRDAPVHAGERDYWGLHTGLLDINTAVKPSLAAFSKVARAIGDVEGR